MFRSKSKNSTGVHFGDDALHIVELSETGGEIALQSIVSLERPSKLQGMAAADGRMAEAMVLLLRTARRDHGISFQNPFVALHSRSFLLKRRTLAKGGANESREHLEWEACQFLTEEAEAFSFDFLVAAGFGFVVAARQTAIDWMRIMCSDADIEKPGFDVAPFALFNALESSGAAAIAEKQLLVDVDRLEARLVLVSSSALAGVETCRWDRSGPLPGNDAGSDTVPNDAGHQIDSSAQLDLLVQAMERLESNGGDGGVDRIWVSGDEAALWCEPIARRTSVATGPLNPFAAVDTSQEAPDDTKAAYSTAAGLAFRGLTEA